MATEMNNQEMSASELRLIFSRNLAAMVGGEKSVAECARRLRISRSQMNRFLSGNSYPRPEILERICRYFSVDARIMTTPLEEIPDLARHDGLPGMLPMMFRGLQPVAQATLPDGIYAEWLLSTVERGMVEQNLIRVYTEGGRRLGRVRISNEMSAAGTRRFRYPMSICQLQFFTQRDGFATIDRVGEQNFHAFTSYRIGFGPTSGVFPGYKLAGITHHPRRLFARTPCLLQQVPGDCHSLLAAAREPEFRRFEQAPPLVQRILKEIQDEAGFWQPV